MYMIVDMITPKTALKRIIESRNSNASYAEDGVPRNGPVSGLFPGLFPGLSGPVSGPVSGPIRACFRGTFSQKK
jgi:hypothetical protein